MTTTTLSAELARTTVSNLGPDADRYDLSAWRDALALAWWRHFAAEDNDAVDRDAAETLVAAVTCGENWARYGQPDWVTVATWRRPVAA